jgi:hypothetical protein
MNRRCAILLGLIAFGFAACETREIAEPKTGQSTSEGRTLVFEDDFERGSLGPNWRRGQGEDGGGEWQIVDGEVRGSRIRNDPLWLTRQLPKNVRIEFEARALNDEGDIKVEVFGDGRTHESGYILIFGGWNNKLDVIARLDEHGQDRKARPTKGVEPRTTYEMAIERTGSSVKWFVDGEHFMTYEDPKPLRGRDHRYFAFNNWVAPVAFDDVKVYRLPAGE